MAIPVADVLAKNPLFRRLSDEDRHRLAGVSEVRSYERGARIFTEGDPAEILYTIDSGRVKVVKMQGGGKEVIFEILGAGDPVGAVAVYEARPYPASAIALEDCTLIRVRRAAFFALLETSPSLVRGLLNGLSLRLMELTRRIEEVSGSRVETRLARVLLMLADRMGRPAPGGTFIPLPLSRQELADLAGTTIETAIRIMSRWGKDGLVVTEKDGFVVPDRAALERVTRI
ncbi:MAG TPA: Crp/Fnr family transcriptional regulator [Candidatus Polarisedimenticolaceae bacterium]|nr:Crp/Fnr family transcriptional regulator [Candidatus Polarisedimenticolaceae bacterium]